MCDGANRSFRAQLAVILDRLTKAALAEISSLADECSSVLHTEISLHKTENEALKKRCYSLEVQLRAAREGQTYPVHVNTGVRQLSGRTLQLRILQADTQGFSIFHCIKPTLNRLVLWSILLLGVMFAFCLSLHKCWYKEVKILIKSLWKALTSFFRSAPVCSSHRRSVWEGLVHGPVERRE